MQLVYIPVNAACAAAICNRLAITVNSGGLLTACWFTVLALQLDAGSTAADKAAPTTVPQLSSASLSAAVADLPGGRLFALLTSGHIHVWDLHLTRPPALTVSDM